MAWPRRAISGACVVFWMSWLSKPPMETKKTWRRTPSSRVAGDELGDRLQLDGKLVGLRRPRDRVQQRASAPGTLAPGEPAANWALTQVGRIHASGRPCAP